MRLILRASTGGVKAQLVDDASTLRQYGAVMGDSLLIVDDDPYSASANGWLEDVTKVEKYVLSEEAYDKKHNTYRKFKERMREKDPNWSMTSSLAQSLNALNKRPTAPSDLAEELPNVKVADRVEVFPGGRRALVKFVGRQLKDMPEGWWLGVAYDDPVGKNDGTVKGVRYFEAPQGHGGLVRPSNCTVGHFPVDDLEESDDEI